MSQNSTARVRGFEQRVAGRQMMAMSPTNTTRMTSLGLTSSRP